jgi:methionine biosynthesis protein MetW
MSGAHARNAPSRLAGEAESRSDREGGAGANPSTLAPAPPSPTLPRKAGESASAPPRLDLIHVADMVEPGSRVLDVGCGDGSLLALLRESRNVDARGIELSREGVSECLAKGLPVIQGDADTDLRDYPDDAFDYVILSQTLQATRHPRTVLENMLRIGRRAIVSFPNFGHWRIRYEVGLRGRMPMTDNLPHTWYDTPNIHFCTIRDFVALCREVDAKMERAMALNAGGQPVRVNMPWWVWNMFGEQAVFLLRRGADGAATIRTPRTP